MERKKMRELAREIAKLERMTKSEDQQKVLKAQARLMEIFDDPEVFQNIDRLDDMVQSILEKG
jgi:predicted nuclease of restriction endonuclease-like (RecB) superfamily